MLAKLVSVDGHHGPLLSWDMGNGGRGVLFTTPNSGRCVCLLLSRTVAMRAKSGLSPMGHPFSYCQGCNINVNVKGAMSRDPGCLYANPLMHAFHMYPCRNLLLGGFWRPSASDQLRFKEDSAFEPTLVDQPLSQFTQHRLKHGLVPPSELAVDDQEVFAYQESGCLVNLVLWVKVSIIRQSRTGMRTWSSWSSSNTVRACEGELSLLGGALLTEEPHHAAGAAGHRIDIQFTVW